MTPFALKQYDKDFKQFRDLREDEIASVGGAYACPGGKETTTTVTTSGSKDDGCDSA